ncbi:MAG: hypothetical protein RKE49_13665 [Oceanicaulis sp.]
MTRHASIERDMLTVLRDSYESRGYTFVEHPGRSLLPQEFDGYRPDAIAIKDAEKLAIEIKNREAGQQFSSIAACVNKAPGWTLHIVAPGEVEPEWTPTGLPGIEFDTALGELDALIAGGHLVAAELYAWSVFEAAAISKLSAQYGADLTARRSPRSLIGALEINGEISSEEARLLTGLSRARNAVAHGDHQSVADSSQLQIVIDFIKRLISQAA